MPLLEFSYYKFLLQLLSVIIKNTINQFINFVTKHVHFNNHPIYHAVQPYAIMWGKEMISMSFIF